MDLSSLLFLRAAVWFLGLLILPGLYIIRMTRIVKHLPNVGKIAIGINLSLVLIGLTALIIYYVKGNVILLPWFLLSILAILGCMHWFKTNVHLLTVRPKLSEWNLLLITAIVVTIFIAFSIQLTQRYLIPGDVWVSLNPAIQVVSQRNVYEAFTGQYPIVFGFVLAGLSVCSGLPIVNTYVLLFPLVALNIISFFVLVKIVFNQNNKVATIASIIYSFSGGLAWLIQTIVYHGTVSFWTLSHLTQDMYFTVPFWNDIMFSYKSLALTLAYASLVLFTLTTKFKDTPRKVIMLTLSSLLMLFSFFIHMLEPLILAPVILAIAYVYQRGRSRYLNLGLLAVITILIAYTIDFLMYGWYSWLTGAKINGFLSIVGMDKLLIYSLLALAGISIIIMARHFLYRRFAKNHAHKSQFQSIKLLLVAGLIGIYLSGLYFHTHPSSLGLSSSFPWYLYVTRYGFVGLLTLIGVGVTEWKEKWFILASFWGVLVIIMGSIWWGSRINAYLFPMTALLAAVGINGIWRKANTSLQISITTTSNSITRSFKLNLKPITAALIILVLALSFTSVIYGAKYYCSGAPHHVTDDEVRAFSWIHQNVSENVTVMVPQIYKISKGVATISDRQVYESVRLPTVMNGLSFINLTKTPHLYNIKYAVSIDGVDEPSNVAKCLFYYSTLVFQSGKVKVFKLPPLNTPSQEHTVAILDRPLLGLQGETHSFGWVDDSFTDGWFYGNVKYQTNGEVLTFEWDFDSKGEAGEPWMKRSISTIDTNRYPYIIIRYRNTAETNAEGFGQIVTLRNQTAGFIKNFFLPISKEDTFRIFTAKLPEDQKVAQVWLWMRNYEKINGTIGLKIDFIGFASMESTPESPTNIQFLSMAIPALWPTNYSISSNFDEAGKVPILVSTYDKNVLNYVKDATHTRTFVFYLGVLDSLCPFP